MADKNEMNKKEQYVQEGVYYPLYDNYYNLTLKTNEPIARDGDFFVYDVRKLELPGRVRCLLGVE